MDSYRVESSPDELVVASDVFDIALALELSNSSNRVADHGQGRSSRNLGCAVELWRTVVTMCHLDHNSSLGIICKAQAE